MTIVCLEQSLKYETQSVVRFLTDELLFKDTEDVSDMLHGRGGGYYGSGVKVGVNCVEGDNMRNIWIWGAASNYGEDIRKLKISLVYI